MYYNCLQCNCYNSVCLLEIYSQNQVENCKQEFILLSFLLVEIREAKRGRRPPLFQTVSMPRIVCTIAKRPSHSRWHTDFFNSISSGTEVIYSTMEAIRVIRSPDLQRLKALALRPKQPEAPHFAERMRIAPVAEKRYYFKAGRAEGLQLTTRVTMPTTQRKSACVRSNGTRYLMLLVLLLPNRTPYFWATKWFGTKEFFACVTGVVTSQTRLDERKATGDASDPEMRRTR